MKTLAELHTNLCDQTSVLYHLTPQIVGSLFRTGSLQIGFVFGERDVG